MRLTAAKQALNDLGVEAATVLIGLDFKPSMEIWRKPKRQPGLIGLRTRH